MRWRIEESAGRPVFVSFLSPLTSLAQMHTCFDRAVSRIAFRAAADAVSLSFGVRRESMNSVTGSNNCCNLH
jgi:hypothetical protein